MAGDLVSERFNGGGDGVAITTSNSSITAVANGTPAFETGDGPPVEGSACMKCVQTALTSVRWDFTNTGSTPMYVSGYVYLDANPATAGYVQTQVNNTATIRAQLRRTSTGAFDIRNGTTNVATSGAITAAQWVRFEWLLTWGATPSQRLLLFIGSNQHGDTPDYDSGAVTLTDNTRNRVVLGSVAQAQASGYVLCDFFDVDTAAFEGAAVTAVPLPVLATQHVNRASYW